MREWNIGPAAYLFCAAAVGLAPLVIVAVSLWPK